MFLQVVDSRTSINKKICHYLRLFLGKKQNYNIQNFLIQYTFQFYSEIFFLKLQQNCILVKQTLWEKIIFFLLNISTLI